MAVTAHATAYGPEPANQFPFVVLTSGPYAAAGLANGTYSLFVMPFAGDVEKITVRQSGTAASQGTLLFKAAASGTAPGSGTAITATENADQFTTDTPFDVPVLAAGAGLASGTVIAVTTASTINNVAGLMIEVVLRRKPLRTSDGGNRVY